MSEAEYTVQYVDESSEEVKYLKREGDVKITYANGDSFEGVIGAGKLKQGQGKYTWRTAGDEGELKVLASYDGNYVDGVKSGVGRMVFPNGDIYHGEWKDNKLHGDGSFIYANGDIFSGKFENGIRTGQGTYEFAGDRSLLVGNWSDNTIVDGKWIFKSGGSYTGRFENGKPIGNGYFKFPNGLQQDGEYIKETSNEGTITHKFVAGSVLKVN